MAAADALSLSTGRPGKAPGGAGGFRDTSDRSGGAGAFEGCTDFTRLNSGRCNRDRIDSFKATGGMAMMAASLPSRPETPATAPGGFRPKSPEAAAGFRPKTPEVRGAAFHPGCQRDPRGGPQLTREVLDVFEMGVARHMANHRMEVHDELQEAREAIVEDVTRLLSDMRGMRLLETIDRKADQVIEGPVKVDLLPVTQQVEFCHQGLDRQFNEFSIGVLKAIRESGEALRKEMHAWEERQENAAEQRLQQLLSAAEEHSAGLRSRMEVGIGLERSLAAAVSEGFAEARSAHQTVVDHQEEARIWEVRAETRIGRVDELLQGITEELSDFRHVQEELTEITQGTREEHRAAREAATMSRAELLPALKAELTRQFDVHAPSVDLRPLLRQLKITQHMLSYNFPQLLGEVARIQQALNVDFVPPLDLTLFGFPTIVGDIREVAGERPLASSGLLQQPLVLAAGVSQLAASAAPSGQGGLRAPARHSSGRSTPRLVGPREEVELAEEKRCSTDEGVLVTCAKYASEASTGSAGDGHPQYHRGKASDMLALIERPCDASSAQAEGGSGVRRGSVAAVVSGIAAWRRPKNSQAQGSKNSVQGSSTRPGSCGEAPRPVAFSSMVFDALAACTPPAVPPAPAAASAVLERMLDACLDHGAARPQEEFLPSSWHVSEAPPCMDAATGPASPELPGVPAASQEQPPSGDAPADLLAVRALDQAVQARSGISFGRAAFPELAVVRKRHYWTQTETLRTVQSSTQTDNVAGTTAKKPPKVTQDMAWEAPKRKSVNRTTIKNVMIDQDAMRTRAMAKMAKRQYNVHDWYHQKGCFQAVAKSAAFEYCTLTVICLNAFWIAIDVDHNNSNTLVEAHPIFQIGENLFCFYFFFEVLVRFCAFRHKRDSLKDFWFVFDSFLVSLMILETWVLTLYIIASASSFESGLGGMSMLRIFRLVKLARVSRVARVLRSVPELLILVKGLKAASRSVVVFFAMWLVMIYVWSLFLRMVGVFETRQSEIFTSVGGTMNLLLLKGILPYHSDFIMEAADESWFFWPILIIFIVVAYVMLMNMLIGVSVEVITTVAITEREGITVLQLATGLREKLVELGFDTDEPFTSEDLESFMEEPAIHAIVERIGTDLIGVLDCAHFYFEERETDRLKFEELVQMIMSLRGANNAKVKDVKSLLRSVRSSIKETEYQMTLVVSDELHDIRQQIFDIMKTQMQILEDKHEAD